MSRTSQRLNGLILLLLLFLLWALFVCCSWFFWRCIPLQISWKVRWEIATKESQVIINTSWGLDWDSKVQSLTIISINIERYLAQQGAACGCAYRSGFAAHLLFPFLHLVPAAVVFTRGGHAKNIVSSGEATVAAGPAVVNWLITEKKAA